MSAPPAQAPSVVGQGPPPVYDPDATAAAELCPSCATPREGLAMFCEECRYNFQTHSATTYVATPPSAPPFPPYQRYESSQRSRPSQVNRPAEPLAPEAVTSDSGDFLLPPPSAPSTPVAPPPARPGPAAPVGPVAPVGPTASFPEAAPSAQAPSTTAHAGSSTPATASESSTASPAAPASPVTPSAPAAEGWTAVVAADRAYYTAMMARSDPDAGGLYFPQFSPAHHVPLTGNQITIGRRRHSTGVAPDIDLSRSPEDPGVSHRHAVLVKQPDGTWSVVDQDSTNGTTVNDGEDPIQPHLPVPLRDGDRVHVGAWTTITVRRG